MKQYIQSSFIHLDMTAPSAVRLYAKYKYKHRKYFYVIKRFFDWKATFYLQTYSIHSPNTRNG